MDRTKRGEEGEEEVVVVVVTTEEEAAAAGDTGMVAYSAVVLRFGCTGGGRSVVGRDGDEERD